MKLLKQRTAVILLLAILLLGAALGMHPYARWRIALISLKIGGRSGLSWSQVFSGLKGDRGEWLGTTRIFLGVRGLVSGRVRLEFVQEGGACRALWDTPQGRIWGRATDGPVLEAQFHEQSVAKIYQNDYVDVSPGDVVFDIGSHLGTFTRSALSSGASLVVAFEPEPTNIACFKRSFEEEIRARRMILIEAAAWDEPGTLTFATPPIVNTATGKVDEAGELLVEAVTIDSVVERLHLDRLDFIKMDIEGAEQRALAGARGLLTRFKPRMALSIYHKPEDSEQIPAWHWRPVPSTSSYDEESSLIFGRAGTHLAAVHSLRS